MADARVAREGMAPGGHAEPSRRWGEMLTRYGLHTLVILLCFLTIFPLFWMLSTSFKIPSEVFTKNIQLLPLTPTLANFPDAFRYFPVAEWFWNSFFISAMTTIGKLAVSIPAAYAFARLTFRGSTILFAAVLATMIVPGIVTYVPNYVLISDLGWINTPQGVIVPSIAHTAFFVFLLRQYIRTLPQEILDAARIDGATTWKVLWQIVMPNLKPVLAVVTILSFLGGWNQYTWPLLVLNDLESKTLAVGMQYFSSNAESAQLWGPMMATATLATLPPLIIYAFAQKQIISTFVTSGMKG